MWTVVQRCQIVARRVYSWTMVLLLACADVLPGAGGAMLTFEPSAIDFGMQDFEESTTVSLQVTNTGDASTECGSNRAAR